MNRRKFITGVAAATLIPSVVRAQVVGPLVIPGGHYLSPLNTPDPIVYSDVLGATSLWSTPHLGESNAAAIHDGTGFVMMRINQLELPLSTSVHLANNIYPVFLFLDTTGPILLTGPAWTTVAYGASISGSGAACVRDPDVGLLVNASAITGYRGAVSYAVPAGRGYMVGCIRPYANGLLRRDISAGKNRRCDVWNLNKRRIIKLVVTEEGSGSPGYHWFYGNVAPQSGAPRHLNGDVNNYADIFTGTPQNVRAEYTQVLFPNTTNFDLGIRWNNEVSSSGAQKWLPPIVAVGRNDSHTVTISARHDGAFGLNKMAPVECFESPLTAGGTGTAEMFGGEYSCACTVEYEG